MVSSINTSSYINQINYKGVGTAFNTVSTPGSFAQCIQTASESQKQSENLSNELKKATSGISSCGKCGAIYMGQEPPPVCAKCGYEASTDEQGPQKTEEAAKTYVVPEAKSDTGI